MLMLTTWQTHPRSLRFMSASCVARRCCLYDMMSPFQRVTFPPLTSQISLQTCKRVTHASPSGNQQQQGGTSRVGIG